MHKTIIIPSRLEEIKKTASLVASMLKDANVDEADAFDIRLSIEEALINAVKYGNKLDEKLDVKMDVDISEDEVSITIEDRGEGFDHGSLPDPTKDENLLKSSGRGVFLIKHLMDRVDYNDKGNCVTLTKSLKKKTSKAE